MNNRLKRWELALMVGVVGARLRPAPAAARQSQLSQHGNSPSPPAYAGKRGNMVPFGTPPGYRSNSPWSCPKSSRLLNFST